MAIFFNSARCKMKEKQMVNLLHLEIVQLQELHKDKKINCGLLFQLDYWSRKLKNTVINANNITTRRKHSL